MTSKKFTAMQCTILSDKLLAKFTETFVFSFQLLRYKGPTQRAGILLVNVILMDAIYS